ncbi:hypothetical protein MHD_10235 [Mannheimia granulomatis]|uniref:Mu-like prophage FluMu protein gp29 n=1 Tax=Mannheimia granulomatis TaxID=85402 RepID=A0A011P6Y9_9PAST|nr:DUF935 family protein [Mannheimia granulomatis]EXI62219.1 hypothetical protein AK33_05700 [Mannheimia granulomatis]RGE47343.1 hypothetical protein MHD_10235 [Mannheimia granulomatis]
MKKDLINEIATRARSFDGWSFGYYLPNPDPVLKKMGKDISTYRELLSDGQVRSGVRRRKAAIKGLNWRITTTNNTKIDEALNAIFEALPLNHIITEMLNASLFGYQVSEVMWAKQSDLIIPTAIVGKKPEWFVFDEENRLRFRTKDSWLEGELLPEHKFLLTTQEATQDNPYGLGDLSLCFWAATFKKGGFKFWLEFVEKYGSPWLVGKHPRQTAEPDKEALADSLEAMIGTAIAVVPNDSSVEILEAAGKGTSSDSYERFLNFCKGEINIALLGQNQTTEQDSNRASAQAGLEVVEDIRNDDKAMIEETLNQLLQWICHYNFAVETLPRFEFYEQEEIDTVLVGRDEKLFGLGVRFSQQYLERTYGFEKGDIELATTQQAVGTTPKFANFSEPHTHKRKPIDEIIDQMGELASYPLNSNIANIRAKLDMAGSLEECQQILDDFIPELEFAEYAQLFAEGLTLANLRGRFEVQEEGKR